MLKADRREETIQVITDEDKIERRSVTDKDFQLQMYILRVATVRRKVSERKGAPDGMHSLVKV